jgi:hypothetical protein
VSGDSEDYTKHMIKAGSFNKQMFDYIYIANHQQHVLAVTHYVKICTQLLADKSSVKEDEKMMQRIRNGFMDRTYSKTDKERRVKALQVTINDKQTV